MELILKFIFLISLFSITTTFKCGFNTIKRPPIGKISPDNSLNSKLRNTESRAIQIKVDYEILSNQISDKILLAGIEDSFDAVIAAFQKYLKVKNPKTYKFSSNSLNGYKLDFKPGDVPILLNNGLGDADVYLVPYTSSLEEEVDAAGYPILLDQESNRPILGGILLGTHFDFSKKNTNRFFTMLLLHEISHVLAFNYDLFPLFEGITEPTTILPVNGLSRVLLKTPKVLEKAKGHFGCPSLKGVELEDQGGNGSAGSHWEARIMLGDYMISTDYPELVVSDITLAVFEDSGWYEVNYFTGGLFKTGKGEGCNFLQKTCVDTDDIERKSRFPMDFCNTEYEVCSPGMLDRGECYIGQYSSSIMYEYQYFGDTKIGGFEPADYCPVAMSYPSETGNYYLYSRCDSNGKKILPDEIHQTFGEESFCFQSSLMRSSVDETIKNKYGDKLTARCLKITQCDPETLSYKVQIDTNKDFNCSDATSQKAYEVNEFEGIFVCPPYWRICGGNALCNDPLKCATAEVITQMTDTTNYVVDKAVYDPKYEYPNGSKFVHFNFWIFISLLIFIL